MASSSETPFSIAVPESQISLLKQKLALATFPDELDEAGWLYGAPLADIKRLAKRWEDGYDWRKHEAALNAELPQFTRDIDIEGFGALNIHYVHKKSKVDGAIPLLFVHGWPGSFIEVRKILPLLVEASPEHPSFHVVAFSLPGYGFSAAPTKKGFGATQYAELGNKLMLALGYDEYVTQGGDWGFRITREIAHIYGHKHSKAWHTNFPLADPPSIKRPLLLLSHLLSYLPPLSYSASELAGLKRSGWFRTMGQGYFMLQTTRPQTIGYSLADSPVGLLAWIYEKLTEWTDGYPWDDDEVLTWISIYYFSRAGPAASLRIYYEVIQGSGANTFSTSQPTTIPVGYSYFPQELARLPRSWTKTPYLVFEGEHDSGGHFAAHEKPEELVGDLRKMFGRGGGDICSTYSLVKNHGISDEHITGALEAGKKFFALDTSLKMELDIGKSTNFKGYTALLQENVNPTGLGDLHEGFDIGWEPEGCDPLRLTTIADSAMSGTNIWPDNLPGFKEAVLAYYHDAIGIGRLLFPLFALALDLPEDFFADKITRPAAIMRILHYPPQPRTSMGEDGRQIGIGEHTDLGDQFARWTNDVFKSTPHRAINRSGKARYSIPLFFGTDYNVPLKSIPTCVSDEFPAKYEDITAGEYVKSRLAATYAVVH
ncbi:hypothetical protein H0H81_011227 [Sphagnurus paluster]|uniref:Epoxide hydrolase n=1 Tax=Sphagnurus paluster TaxID=117069 RepID=A0A9P7FQI9_9AGAR|nr:hypothetical protein H0H81_011227 [Sphagnurus paluster]